jgi:hypothetical protein
VHAAALAHLRVVDWAPSVVFFVVAVPVCCSVLVVLVVLVVEAATRSRVDTGPALRQLPVEGRVHRECHGGHEHAEDTLEAHHDPACPDAAPHTEALVGPVRELPAWFGVGVGAGVNIGLSFG